MCSKVNKIGDVADERSHAVIMVIDDVETSRLILKRRLSIYGSEVILCDGVDSAYKFLSENHVDVIFIEFAMAGITGLEILKNLKASQKFVSIPVIMMSARADVNNVVQCIEAGAEDFLQKPFNHSLLKARLSNAILKKQAHDREVNYIEEIKENQRRIVTNEKMTSLGNMAVAVSDELKNPLNLVTNLSEVSCDLCKEIVLHLEKFLKEPSIDAKDEIVVLLMDLEKDVKKISEQGKKADKILRFMIDQSQAYKSEFYEANLNKLITNTVKVFLSESRTKNKKLGIKVQLKLDNRIPKKLYIAAQAFGIALFNIIENAIYFLHKKESDEPKILSIETKNLDDTVDVFIKDNGCGIEKNKLRLIFEPFFTTKDSDEAQGLGLATVSEVIVQIHKGSVSVNSELGKFTEFKITLPKLKNKPEKFGVVS